MKFVYQLCLFIFFNLSINALFGQTCPGVILTPGVQQCGDTDDGGNTVSNNPCMFGWDTGDDYFYQITVPAANDGDALELNLTTSEVWVALAVSDACGGGSCFKTNTFAGIGGPILSSPLVGGTTYYIHISSWAPPSSFTFCLDSKFVTPPSNDNCSGVIDLNPGNAATSGSVTSNNCTAPNDYVLDCLFSSTSPDMVYSIEVPNNCTLTIGDNNISYESRNRLAYGGTCPGINLIACNTNPNPNPEIWTNNTGASQTAYWIQSSIDNACGDFTIDWSIQHSLPITLVEFRAEEQVEFNEIFWSTLNEINNKSQELERSDNGSNWENIYKIEGLINSYELINYSFLDRHPLPLSYYRLKSVDHDGFIQYSEVITLRRDNRTSKNFRFHAFPNPCTDRFSIEIDSQYDDIGTIYVRDIKGKNILIKKLRMESGKNIFDINSSLFEAGIYIIDYSSEKVQSSIKLVKN